MIGANNRIKIYSSAIKDSRNMLIHKGHSAKVGSLIEGHRITHIDSFGSYDAVYFDSTLKRMYVAEEQLAIIIN